MLCCLESRDKNQSVRSINIVNIEPKDLAWPEYLLSGAGWSRKGQKSMINNCQECKKRPRVFLSYSHKDEEVAKIIAERLRNENIDIWFDMFESNDSESLKNSVNNAISASDYLIMLLSQDSASSDWINLELNIALNKELNSRDITILPVLIKDCRIPSNLSRRRFIDLRSDFEKGINKLINQIELIPEIDFSMLNYREFESLTIDLLKHLGFKDIESEFQIGNKIYDLKAIFSRFDPFGASVSETWLIELKLYKESKADLRSINQFTINLMDLSGDFKGLLITNSTITSPSREWLENNKKSNRIAIKIVDSTELKRLLLKNKKLVNKYFKDIR